MSNAVMNYYKYCGDLSFVIMIWEEKKISVFLFSLSFSIFLGGDQSKKGETLKSQTIEKAMGNHSLTDNKRKESVEDYVYLYLERHNIFKRIT